MTKIAELIEIPDHVGGGDFVLALTDGVARPEETIGDYVITDNLVRCFRQALLTVRDALNTNRSKAVYLHGSFGSGKSHFMAVLSLLLDHNEEARAIAELHGVVAEMDEWTHDKRFLVVPYHLIGAEDLESAILGGYVRWVGEHHPDAPIPPVYEADPILDNAQQMRAAMGDDVFFARLNGDGGGDAKWGRLSSGWDAARFDAAAAARGDDPDRLALVSVVVDRLLPAVRGLGTGFVSIDEGLKLVAAHARELGYDAVVLFLDELILWFASRIADLAWAHREGPKLAKLVESGAPDRAVPIVSFVARQRDLRELVGGTGAEQMQFFDALQWWEGRFDTITLEDRNLPIIANRRILRPRSDEARMALEHAVDDVLARHPAAADVLLGSGSDRLETAKLVYPFSPALVTTLVDVSSVLQRNRTALKVMQQLLVDQRDVLEVGNLVPVGDLFDVIRSGDQPFSPAMQLQFDHAVRLYDNKIRPILLRRHEVTDDQVDTLPWDHAFRASDRLVKTLLMAALVHTSAFEDLTAAKLEALNAGSIDAFIPGTEVNEVVELLRHLIANGVGEIELSGDPQNPRVTLRLSGIETASIIEGARSEDTVHAQRAKVRELIAGAVQDPDLFESRRRQVEWRGTTREVEIVFGNIRSETDLPDERFVADELPKVVLDFPFDPDGFPPRDDVARVEELARRLEPTLTACWLPSHFTAETRQRLGDLVVLDHLLIGDNFERNAGHLSPEDRLVARRQIEAQRNSLREELLFALEEAYAVRPVTSRYLEEPLGADEQFQSLDPSLRLHRPAAADLQTALDDLCGQLLTHRYPAHPEFERPLTVRDLEKVWEQVERAARSPLGRLEDIPSDARRLLARIAQPLDLGIMFENHFVLADTWKNRLLAAEADASSRDPGFVPTVGWLRARLDEPDPRGLTTEVANLVIGTFALQADRSFVRHGATIPFSIRSLSDDTELRRLELPDADEWRRATHTAAAVFGVPASELVSAENLARLAEDVRSTSGGLDAGAHTLVAALDRHAGSLDVADDADRPRTARAAAELVDAIRTAVDDRQVIAVLAGVEPPTSLDAMGASLKQANKVSEALSGARWELIERAFAMPTGGPELRATLRRAAEADQIVTRLDEVLARVEDDATRLVLAAAQPTGTPPDGGSGPVAVPGSVQPANPAATTVTAEASHIDEREVTAETLDAATAELRDHVTRGGRAWIRLERTER